MFVGFRLEKVQGLRSRVVQDFEIQALFRVCTVDGERGLGDVGGDDNLPSRGPSLHFGRRGRVEHLQR